jgi:hypothetical protein
MDTGIVSVGYQGRDIAEFVQDLGGRGAAAKSTALESPTAP